MRSLPFKITAAPIGGDARVEMDGVDISRYLTRFDVSASVDRETTITLTLVNVEVSFEGPAEVLIDGSGGMPPPDLVSLLYPDSEMEGVGGL